MNFKPLLTILIFFFMMMVYATTAGYIGALFQSQADTQGQAALSIIQNISDLCGRDGDNWDIYLPSGTTTGMFVCKPPPEIGEIGVSPPMVQVASLDSQCNLSQLRFRFVWPTGIKVGCKFGE